MYPWIASPAMAKVVAFDMMRADHAASREKGRPQRAAAQDATAEPPVTAAKTRRPRWVARALHLAH